MTTPEEIKAEYTSSLADLTFNSKPLINVLTMLAEENLPNAKIIVEAIEEHLAKVATDVKLPILYLIDCIVKNVGRTYTGLFSQNIVSTFCTVFKLVDEKTRLEMFKLRQTWNDVFPQMKLYAIDVQIHQIDPAWPVTAHPSNSIHLNPKFLKNSPTTPKAKSSNATTDTAVPSMSAKPVVTDIDKETLLMQEQLIQKQKELLELQRKTLELEVLQTQVKLQEQMKAGGAPPISTNILLKPEVAKQLIPEAMTKTRPTGIANAMHQRLQNHQPKINPVNSALAAARPIRDPRLLRQQQQQQQLQQQLEQQQQQTMAPSQQAPAADSAASSVLAEKSAVFENNKNVTNKQGVRNISKDPRLSSKTDKKSKTIPKTRDSADSTAARAITINNRTSNDHKSSNDSPTFNSSSSSSLGSTSSGNLDSPTKNRRSSNKHKKREKPEAKRSEDFEGSSIKREKIAPKEDSNKYIDTDKRSNDDASSSFKSVKNKNRNYMRRNLADSPVQLQDEDLREKVSRQPPGDLLTAERKSPDSAVSKPMDVDLRQLPPALTKKRTSIEASEQPAKKSRSFDVLFGSEDTDLRQLPVQPEPILPAAPIAERPPTPPPPIISVDKVEESVMDIPVPASPKKSDLDAVRAKLANATSRDKVIAKSFHKNKLQQAALGDQDLRKKVSPKITISPEEEMVIRSGQMTREQESQIFSKILIQIEKDKLREAKIKDHEESFKDMSLQAISDDEFGSDIDDKPGPRVVPPPEMPPLIPPPPMPFNDKDERLNIHHMATMMPQPHIMETIPPGMDNGPAHHPPFYPRGDVRRPPFRGGRDNWRGRGRSMPMQGPQSRPSIRPWLHQQQMPPQPRWRGPVPFVPPPRPEFMPLEEEASRSPGQDFGPQEMTMHREENKTLNIDGIPRDIRIYNQTAIIFLNYDDPREISFQSGMRRVHFNNNESYPLSFGDGYKECLVNGFPFRVKLGVPSREIFINDVGFECFFGGAPVHVTVNGINMMVALEGPPPQVKIGDEVRTDLVVGKINLIVNATLIVPVFLDAKVQKFVVDGEPCTLKFVDALKRVLINDVPFNVEFGGLPKPCLIHDKKHFIRFSVLPKGVRPGYVKIKDMEGESGSSPVRIEEASQDSFGGLLEVEPLRPELSNAKQSTGQESPDNRSNSPGFLNNMLPSGLNNFDVISNVLSQSLAPAPTTGGYQVELPGLAPSSAAPQEGDAPPQTVTAAPKHLMNINELFQKLVASGFVKTQEKPPVKDQEVVCVDAPAGSPDVVEVPVSNGKHSQLESPSKKTTATDPNAAKPQKRSLLDVLKPISFARPKTLKIRQAPLYSILYTGMQCSSCGMRFPPEASMWYSQHLDWHFRQNRRGKKNARVANSRKWYYALGDWKNYEELEDLEEREKNYFDQQQQAEVAEEAEEEVEIPTVSADPGTTNEKCHVCRDAFEQFFNEEKEEWHLRNAIKMDDKTYHPVCYEDYQKSILEESLDESKTEGEPQNKLIPGLEIVLDDDDDEAPGTPNEVVSLIDDDEELKIPEDAPSPEKDDDLPEEDDGDDDDVILNEVAPIKIVVDDDDDDEPMEEQQNGDGDEAIVIKKEKKVVFDDGFVDVGEIVTMPAVGQVKIKSEPVDDESTNMDTSRVSDVQDGETPSEPPTPDVFENPPTSQPQPVTSHQHLITSIDGNIDVSSNASSAVLTTIAGGTKIKINISKPLPVITPKENSESSDNSEVVKSSEVPMEEPEILTYKPALQNVPLKKLAAVQKGTELTGLCSIM